MINLIFFMTTKGHFGRKDLYKYSLKNLNNLDSLNLLEKFLSIKIFKNDEEIAEQMIKEINYKTFSWYNPDPNIDDESQYKNYSYYLLGNYLADIVNVYSQKEILKNKYTFIYEDDSPLIFNKSDFYFYINQSIKKLEEDRDIFSIHLKRIGFLKNQTEYHQEESKDLFLSQKRYNFQNQVFRTEDMVNVAQLIKLNWNKMAYLHTEAAVENGISLLNPNFKYLSFNPNFAHSIHIGVPDAEKWIESYKL